jgi:hypothetical protein
MGLAIRLPMLVMGQTGYPAPYTFTTLAGLAGSYGTNDGMGGAARFDSPAGVALDANGNVFVADTQGYTVRKVTPAGLVTTLAGAAGNLGTNDGTGSAARFNLPMSVAVDGAGNLYVADAGNDTIRKLALSGTNWVVTTLAGLAGIPGTNDGTGSAAGFHGPAGVTLDTNGNLYVADELNETIRELRPAGTNWAVTTLAGLPGVSGTNDGTNSDARFNLPFGLAMGANGSLYVADSGNHTIRQMTPMGTNWVVTTLAGLAGVYGTNDGAVGVALFNHPFCVALDGAGNVYVGDTFNNTIREVYLAGTSPVVTTLGGAGGRDGGVDGTGGVARFRNPFGVAVDANFNVYVADRGNSGIRKGIPAALVPRPVLQSPTLSAGQFGFGITGLPNLTVEVQSSSNFTDWQMVNRKQLLPSYYVLVNGTNFFTNSDVPTGKQFYRVHVR